MNLALRPATHAALERFRLRRQQLLQLRAEMKLPGEAMLEFRITPTADGGCTLKQVALFKPKGLLGLAYWYSVLPFHHFVFDGMLRGIRDEAERLGAAGDPRESMLCPAPESSQNKLP